MLRVCGASGERDALSRSSCWCRGLFCGRGGFKATKEFRRQFRKVVTARSRAECDELMRQADLFSGTSAADVWRGRIDGMRARQRERAT